MVNAIVDLEKYPYLKSLEFAMEMGVVNQVSPDILIGSDQYWSLLTGEVIKSNNGPIALSSHLGWILSGRGSERYPYARYYFSNSYFKSGEF